MIVKGLRIMRFYLTNGFNETWFITHSSIFSVSILFSSRSFLFWSNDSWNDFWTIFNTKNHWLYGMFRNLLSKPASTSLQQHLKHCLHIVKNADSNLLTDGEKVFGRMISRRVHTDALACGAFYPAENTIFLILWRYCSKLEIWATDSSFRTLFRQLEW